MDSLSKATRTAAIEEMNRIWWWHSISIPKLGVMTPGHEPSPRSRDAYMKIPEDLTGKMVIDIGAWNGLYSFVAEERGAKGVLAIDLWERRGTELCAGTIYPKRDGIDFARKHRDSSILVDQGDLMTSNPANWGQYDVAFLFGVLYHLQNPLAGLQKLHDLVVPGGLAIIETALDTSPISNSPNQLGSNPLPYMRLTKDGQDGDPTNWWYPNIPCVLDMLKAAGFSRAEYTGGCGSRGAFHAYR